MICVSSTGHAVPQNPPANNTAQEKDEMEGRHAITDERRARHEGMWIFHRLKP